MIGHILVAAIDLEEDGPLSVVCLGGLPSLDYLDLIRVIDEDAHGGANCGQLVGEGGEICDLVRRHGESIKDLDYVRDNTQRSSKIRDKMERPYILDCSVCHQAGTKDLTDFHYGGDDDGVGLIRGGVQLKPSSLWGLQGR